MEVWTWDLGSSTKDMRREKGRTRKESKERRDEEG
jgi:hypothetical protein